MGLPYFPFYPDRWLSSSRIDLMSAEEERGYLRLLMRSWGMPECTLPADPDKLLRWSLMTDAEALRRHMQSMFERVPAGWRSPVLYAEWIKAKNKHETMSKNASARWKRESVHAEALPKQCKGNDNQNQNQNQNQKKQCQKKKQAQAPFVLPDWIDLEAWAGYEEMRQRKRAPMTNKARELTVQRLASLKAQGHDPVAVLNQSIQKSWTGVYPIKEDGESGGNGKSGQHGPRDAAGRVLKVLR